LNRVTASGAGRLLQCSGHVRLPWLRENSAAASEGTRLHAIMETMRGDATASDEMRGEPLALAAWNELESTILSGYGEVTHLEHEAAFILDTETRTGRRVTLAAPREYGPLKWHEVAGTADALVWIEPHDRGQVVPLLVDWKFGMEPVQADSAQLRTLGAAFLTTPAMAEHEGLHVAIVQSNESGVDVRIGYWTRADLLAHTELLGDALNDANEGRIELQRGPECRYCPAANACPSQLAAMSVIVSPGGPGPITLDRAGQIWAELKQAKKRLEAIEDACKALAEQEGGLPLPGGKRLVLATRSRSSVDAKQLEAIARGHGASDEEIDACRKTTTYTTTQEIKA
jgi:hypothetical protein